MPEKDGVAPRAVADGDEARAGGAGGAHECDERRGQHPDERGSAESGEDHARPLEPEHPEHGGDAVQQVGVELGHPLSLRARDAGHPR